MADDHRDTPERTELLHASLDDLKALYDAEAALVDPVDRSFHEIAHRLEHGDDALPGAG